MGGFIHCTDNESAMKPKLPPLQLSKNAPSKPPPPKEKEALLPDDAQAAPGVEKNAAIGRGRKILVVDDNPVVVKALQLKLQASGFVVITATDGGEVVNTVREENPALIILDVIFPPGGTGDVQWSGMTIMQWLTRFSDGERIPIIIVTGEDPAKQREKFLAAGAAGFFQKPVNYGELLSAIIQALGDAPGK